MVKIKDCIIDITPASELKNVLKRASSGHWSAVRKQAFDRLHYIIKENGGILFNSDFRTFGLQTKGESAVFRVPNKRITSLAPFRGELVFIICVDYAEKWPQYSGRKFALLRINESGEILRIKPSK